MSLMLANWCTMNHIYPKLKKKSKVQIQKQTRLVKSSFVLILFNYCKQCKKNHQVLNLEVNQNDYKYMTEQLACDRITE